MTFADWVGVGAVIVPTVISGYKMYSMLKDIQKDQKILKMDTLRIQCLHFMRHDPTNRLTITGLHDKYKNQGGNSYLDAEYEKWEKEYNKGAKK
jgi:hypothetical protein